MFLVLLQKYLQNLQSIAARIEEEREKRKNTELWMSHRILPEHLRIRIRQYRQYKWKKTKGVDENGLINDLPKDLRRDIKRHCRLALLMRVSAFLNFVYAYICSCVFLIYFKSYSINICLSFSYDAT